MAMGALQVRAEADSVRALLERMKGQFELALPKHLTADRLLRVALTAVQNTPKLLECDRVSLLSAVMTCAQLGLEPDGVMGQAYLVPFKGKVVFIAGYKGLITLARNSGEISSIQAHEVCERDHFDFAYGLSERLDHRPATGARGEVTHFYSYAHFKDGGHIFEVLTRADVEKIRDGSEGYKAFKAGYVKTTPWVDHFVQMGRKTAIRRLANYLPRSVQKAAAFEDAYDRGATPIANEMGELVAIEEQKPEKEPAGERVTAKMDQLAGAEAPKRRGRPPKQPEPFRDATVTGRADAPQKEDFEAAVGREIEETLAGYDDDVFPGDLPMGSPEPGE